MKNITLTACALAFIVLGFSAYGAANRPNVVIILADDLGYGDLGCYNANSNIPTPNLDRLATEGMRFTDAHSPSGVCTPTRYGVLTGRYAWRSRLKSGVLGGYSPPLIEKGRATVASLLRKKGYRTACIGKWHLGFHEAFLPRNQGFDYYFGLLHNLDPVEIVYFKDKGGVPLLRNG